MATLPGKTDRYRPNDPSWQPASYYGGFMPNIVPDQSVAQSLPSLVDRTFAALGPLEPQGRTSVASIRPNWTVPTNRTQPGSADSLLAYAGGIPDLPAVNAASDLANPVTNVTAAMKPQSNGGLLDMIFGPSKNGLGGLPGLIGGPQQGGILQMLFGGGKSTAGLPRRAIPASAAKDQRGFAIGEANRRNPNPTRNVSGDNNAFSPTSVQNSSRWQTGY